MLTQKFQLFTLGQEQEQSFNKLKKNLFKGETLRYFDPEAKTPVITDASPIGLDAVLVQIQEENGESFVTLVKA